MENAAKFTHLNKDGNAQMVDVSTKKMTERVAVAYGEIHMNETAATGIVTQTVKKGDVLQVARIAGIMAAKKTPDFIPLCHTILLTKCEVSFYWKSANVLAVKCLAQSTGQTGVEMEALTGVSVALLTVYDMCKAIDREMSITNVHVLEKSGGKSGDFKSTRKV